MRRAREIREERKLSLTDVTRKTTIGIGHLAAFERGEVELGRGKLLELTELYGVTVQDLWEETEEPAAAPVRP